MTAKKHGTDREMIETSGKGSSISLYLKDINRIPLLSREEEERYARAAAAGNVDARNRLVQANLRFVVNVAKGYQGRGVPLQDLISEGNIGLLNAVDRYDVTKGYHFISYAVWWIRQAILREICERSRMIRLPLNRVAELTQIERARKQVQGTASNTEKLQEIARLADMDTSHVADLINISREMVSLDMPIYEEADSTLLVDTIEDTRYEAPEINVEKQALHDDLEDALSSLDTKEAAVIRYRYGLVNGAPMSLREIGDQFNLTKERIRQIEMKALKRLQHPSHQRKLKSYVA
jgi:RNA polymerase primary sigma factor